MEQPAGPVEALEDGCTANILVVDDDEGKLLALQAVLADLGNVVCVRSGREALRTLLNQTFALILLDINMPGIDGFETAQLIRQRQTSEDTPIIFITAYGDDVFMTRSYSLGAVDYILSPIVPDVLRTKVAVFTALYRQTEQIRLQARRLEQRAAQLSSLANQLTEAEHRERRRLARVLHDHLQQLLASAKMRLRLVPLPEGQTAGRRELEDIDRLLDDAIDVSRSLTVELIPPVLHEGGLTKALHWLARRFHKDHGLRVHLEASGSDAGLPAHLTSFLYQAVRELLFNVVKHAGVQEAWVRVDSGQRRVRVTVEDRGAGFNKEALDRCETTPDHFGLFNIRERLRYLDGLFEVDAAEGRGARLRLSAPVVAGRGEAGARPEGPAARGAEALEGRGEPGAGIRVLLADDHRVLRKGLAGMLAAYEDIHIVGEADDGEQAVKLARELRPDVVVIDVAMPRMNGIEATRRIVAGSPAVRVIALSMHDRSEMVRPLTEAGAVGFLNKAGPPEHLIALIRSQPVDPGE